MLLLGLIDEKLALSMYLILDTSCATGARSWILDLLTGCLEKPTFQVLMSSTMISLKCSQTLLLTTDVFEFSLKKV